MKARVFAWSLSLAVSTTFAASIPQATDDTRLGLPAYDMFTALGGLQKATTPLAQRLEAAGIEKRVGLQKNALGYASDFDAKLQSPRFLWAPKTMKTPALGSLSRKQMPEAFGREYLSRQASLLGIDHKMVLEARVTDAQAARDGTLLSRFQQRVDGIDVFNRSVNVLMDRTGKLVATSGSFHGSRKLVGGFVGGKGTAISIAIGDLGGQLAPSLLQAFETRGDYELFASYDTSGNYLLSRAARAKPVYYPQAEGLEAAYYVEVMGTPKAHPRRDAYGYVISASSGKILFRNNLTRYDGGTTAFGYRVFADTTGKRQPYDSPLGNGYVPFPGSGISDELPRSSGTMNLITQVSSPYSRNDAWLPDDATTTTGNHVDAFLDTSQQLALPVNLPVGGELTGDGYLDGTGDLRAVMNQPKAFDYPIAGDADPASADAKQAAIVNLFYMNNWLHDWWYDFGFNEAAGNAQTSNFGRGGTEGDPVSAQGQDSSGRSNANMQTPADGGSPTMQMYLFDGPVTGEVCQRSPSKNCASDSAGSGYKFAGASFGPSTFDVEGVAAIGNDGSAPTSNGCNDLLTIPDPTGLGVIPAIPSIPDPNLLGKIAIIDRGSCSFTSKEQFAMLSGASALVVINNGDGDPSAMGNADLPIDIGVGTDMIYTLPAVMIRKDAGEALKAQIAAGATVTLHVRRDASIDYDGTLDNLVIAHEYFHYVSNRLVNDGSGLSNNQGGSMGEGWGDIDSMLLATRPDDIAVSGNDHYQGAYPTGFYVVPSYYFGIRRMPYSYDFAKNSLTFRHITDGVPLTTVEAAQGQVAAPASFGTDGATNSEVHNSGEVWANMLFNVYVSILNEPGRTFQDAQDHMKSYIICGLKMTPSSPTFTQARDGILSCVQASGDVADFNAASRGFARRGIGLHAVSPASDSTDHVGVVESYIALAASAPTLAPGLQGDGHDATLDACDRDGTLDSGESGLLAFELVNNGGYAPGTIVTAKLVSSSSDLTLADGGRMSFTAGEIGATSRASVLATLASGLTGMKSIALTLKVDAPAAADPAVEYPADVALTLIANTDVARDSATDGFENPALSTPDWTVSGGATWTIADETEYTASGKGWYAQDLGTSALQMLTTPAFTVPADTAFTFQFDQYYEFDGTALTQYDGGVIDVSTDNGATWTDAAAFGAVFSQGYNGTISANSRMGYTGSTSAKQTEKLDFAKKLAGKTVKLRFTLASDASVDALGWIIDNVVVTGAGTPFYSVKAEDGVCAANRAPLVDAGLDRSVGERASVADGLATIALAGSASDPDDVLNSPALQWTQVAGPTVTLSSATTATPSFTAPEVAADTTLTFRLTATDGLGLAAFDEVSITILNVNRGPVANAGADIGGVTASATTLDGRASGDPDGETLTYAWTQTGGATVTLVNADSAVASFTPATAGTYSFALTVTDPYGATATDDVSVTVTASSTGGGGSSGGTGGTGGSGGTDGGTGGTGGETGGGTGGTGSGGGTGAGTGGSTSTGSGKSGGGGALGVGLLLPMMGMALLRRRKRR